MLIWEKPAILKTKRTQALLSHLSEWWVNSLVSIRLCGLAYVLIFILIHEEYRHLRSYLSRAFIRLDINIVMMHISSRHRYLEVVSPEHNRTTLMSKVGSSRTCEDREVWRGSSNWGDEGDRSGGSGSACGWSASGGRSAGRGGRRSGCAGRCAHRGRHAHAARTCLPRWS